MATRKRKEETPESGNYERIKEEVLALLTGQEPGSEEEINYVTVLKRVTLVLIVTYGIARVALVRRLAISIATTFVTRWLAQKATDSIVEPKPALQAR
ncbi:MAG: hypothetical protein JWO03_83 [Bacteroidetes bacterium]|nr:hypothetical protein [Bacteroidota bacterium]